MDFFILNAIFFIYFIMHKSLLLTILK